MAFINMILHVLVYFIAVQAFKTETFDYVIIGGGTCGLTVANRLSEDSTVNVAVIEAGGDERHNPNVTGLDVFGRAFNTHVDWAYKTARQIYAHNRTLGYASGKALGGSSAINGMAYLRANKPEIDAWETLGNAGWNWDALYPYYKKSEQFQQPTKAQREAGASYVVEYHGFKGPLKVGYPYSLMNGTYPGLPTETWTQLGFERNPDAAGGNMRGVFAYPKTLDMEAEIREDSARAYLYPVEKRSNLAVYRGLVERIIWEEDRATRDKVVGKGVKYRALDGTSVTIQVSKEIIISAGSLRSPGVLEHSGVGNPEILDKYNIPTKVSLPSVGENAIDQANLAMLFRSHTKLNGSGQFVTFATVHDLFGRETKDVAESTSERLREWAQSAAEANGNRVDAVAIEKLFAVQHDIIFNHNISCAEILEVAYGERRGSSFLASFPFSRGSVHIQSANSIDYPLINPNYFVVDWDITLQGQIRKLLTRFWNTEPIRNDLDKRIVPDPSRVPDDATDAEWVSWMKSAVSSNLHLVGTASMLPRSLGGVVDERLVVYGTENVRVVDASIFPMQVSGHPTSTLYAVSERAAEFIKKDRYSR